MKEDSLRVVVVGADDEQLAAARAALSAAFGPGVEITGGVGGADGDFAGLAEAARARRTLDEFLNRVSHDLRQPLHVVSGYLELLELRCGEQLDPEARRMLSRAGGGIERLQAMMDGLLVLSRIRGDCAAPCAVDLGAALDEVAASLREREDGGGLQVHHGSLPVVTADPQMVRRLWTALLENVLVHCPATGQRVVVDSAPEGDLHHLTLSDRGPGIPSADFERVFEVFQRGAGKSGPAVGLGLTVVRRIAELYGGRAWAGEGPAGGTTIHFTLSARPVEPPEAEPPLEIRR